MAILFDWVNNPYVLKLGEEIVVLENLAGTIAKLAAYMVMLVQNDMS